MTIALTIPADKPLNKPNWITSGGRKLLDLLLTLRDGEQYVYTVAEPDPRLLNCLERLESQGLIALQEYRRRIRLYVGEEEECVWVWDEYMIAITEKGVSEQVRYRRDFRKR